MSVEVETTGSAKSPSLLLLHTGFWEACDSATPGDFDNPIRHSAGWLAFGCKVGYLRVSDK